MIEIFFLENWDKFETQKACDWQITELVINHQEGHVAKAKIKAANFHKPQWAFLCIYESGKLLFQGAISRFSQSSIYISVIEVLCVNPKFEEHLQSLVNTKNLEYLPDFFQGQRRSFTDYLESENKLFYWDRVSGKPELSCYLKGARNLDIQNNYLKNSLKFRQTNFPISSSKAILKVRWTQHMAGHFNATYYIKKAFPNSAITTFNGESLIADWPKSNNFLNDNSTSNGYKILKSKIAIGSKSCSGIFVKNNDSYLSHLQIHHMIGDLKIGWQYSQIREEEYRLKITSCQNYTYGKNTFNINITLPNSEKAVFFETLQGAKYLKYTEKLIRAKIKASQRCLEIKCKINWQTAKDLSLRDSLIIDASELKQGKIKGKITNINLEIKGTKKIAEITIGYQAIEQENSFFKDTYKNILNGYFEEEFVNDETKSESKIKGITHPILLGKDLIEGVVIKNNTDEILEKIRAVKNIEEKHIEHIINSNPTSIEINLKDLTSETILKRNFFKEIH